MTKANRQFTDRTEPQAAFRDAYLKMAAAQDPSKTSSHIITYYGMGGIGKSRLLEQLHKNLSTDSSLIAKNNKKPLVVQFNFEGAPSDGFLILERLYKILHNDLKWSFPRFEWGLYLYKRKIGMDAEEPKVKSFLDEHNLNTPLNFIGKIPFFSMAVDVVKSVDEAQAFLRNWMRKLYKPQDDIRTKFNGLTAEEMQRELPGLFAENLNAYTAEFSTPLVFLLDTYECIVENNKQGFTRKRDWWLHGKGSLISQTKNTLWVIAGRHKLQWNEENCTMEQHLLGSLSEEDAASFLTGAGIPEALIPGLYELTGGTPIFLDVCVDLYVQLVQSGAEPELSQFGLGDSDRLIECYLKYMDPHIKEMVYMLSFIPLWDKRLVESAARQVLGDFHVAEFNQVKRLSITCAVEQPHSTEEDSDEDDPELEEQACYFIHRAVAEHLRNNPENESRAATAKFLINHFRLVLDTASPYSEEYSHALQNLLYGGMLLYKKRTKLADFYLSTMQEPQNRLCRCHREEVAENLFAPFWERAEEDPSDFLYATALYAKAKNEYHCYDDIPRPYIRYKVFDIMAWTMVSLHLLQKEDKIDHILLPQALEAMAVYFTALINVDEWNFSVAVALHRYAIHLYETEHPQAQLALLLCRRNLALTYQEAKDYDTALALFRENLELAEEALEPGNRHRLQAMQDLADLYSRCGDTQEALEPSKQVLEGRTKHLPENDPGILLSMQNLADLHRRMDNYPEEAKVREKVLRFCRKHIPADHPDMDLAISSLADTYKRLKKYSMELPLRKERLEREHAKYGDGSGFRMSTIEAVDALATVYHNLQQWDQRNDLCLKWCEALPEEAGPLLFLVECDFKDYLLCKQLCQVVLKANPADSRFVKIILAKCHFLCGEFQDALDLLAEVLEAYPEDTRALDIKADILQAMGQTEEAQRLRNTVQDLIELEAWRIIDQEAKQIIRYPGARAIYEVKKCPAPADFTGLSPQEVLVQIYLEMPLESITQLPDAVENELEEQAFSYVQQLPMPDDLNVRYIAPDGSELTEEQFQATLESITQLPDAVANELEEQARSYTQQLPMPDDLNRRYIVLTEEQTTAILKAATEETAEEQIKAILEEALQASDPQ